MKIISTLAGALDLAGADALDVLAEAAVFALAEAAVFFTAFAFFCTASGEQITC